MTNLETFDQHPAIRSGLAARRKRGRSSAPTCDGGIDLLYIVDESASMNGAKRRAAESGWNRLESTLNGSHGARLGGIGFGETARVFSPLAEPGQRIARFAAGGRTDIAGALTLAAAMFASNTPSRRAGAILISDGGHNAGDALADAIGLLKQRALVATIALGSGADRNELMSVATGPELAFAAPWIPELPDLCEQAVSALVEHVRSRNTFGSRRLS